jgi:hypothetical protein
MLVFARAGILAALVTLLSIALPVAASAQKAFVRDDLADAAIKLEAQIKSEAGQVAKTAVVLRREADAAFGRNDFRTGMQILGQIVVVAPTDSANWLRLAKAVLQIRPNTDRERTTLFERASTAAYIAYQRTSSSAEEAESLLVMSRTFADRSLWRPALDALRLSLDLREVAEQRQQYERMREDHGFRLLDYSVDADAASPRACFQFSEDLPGRPISRLRGARRHRPAGAFGRGQAARVEGSYTASATIHYAARGHPLGRARRFPRARSSTSMYATAAVRALAAKTYVAPAHRAARILISVNTTAVAAEIYRIGDRNLLSTVLGNDFSAASTATTSIA